MNQCLDSSSGVEKPTICKKLYHQLWDVVKPPICENGKLWICQLCEDLLYPLWWLRKTRQFLWKSSLCLLFIGDTVFHYDCYLFPSWLPHNILDQHYLFNSWVIKVILIKKSSVLQQAQGSFCTLYTLENKAT